MRPATVYASSSACRSCSRCEICFAAGAALDCFSALARWAKLVGNVPQAVEPLQIILCQVLLRKLCPACREAYRPDAEMLRKANLPAEKAERFYRPPTKPLTDEKGPTPRPVEIVKPVVSRSYDENPWLLTSMALRKIEPPSRMSASAGSSGAGNLPAANGR